MNLVLFGGSFDPPHNGHLAMCTVLRETVAPEPPDKIILSVSKNPLKGDAAISDDHRRELVRRFADDLNATGSVFEVSDWELKKSGASYTIDTLRYLRDRYPDAALWLAVGEDNFRTFKKWREPEQILSLARLIVFARNTSETGTFAPPPNAQVTRLPLALDVSSTEIRARLHNGEPTEALERLMPQVVLRYIEANGLYRA